MPGTVASGTREVPSCLKTKMILGGAARRDLQWKKLRKTLLDQIANIIGRWRESCGNWPVNVVSQARAESYLILPSGTSEETIT
jgi:hypothetical protein